MRLPRFVTILETPIVHSMAWSCAPAMKGNAPFDGMFARSQWWWQIIVCSIWSYRFKIPVVSDILNGKRIAQVVLLEDMCERYVEISTPSMGSLIIP